MSGMYNMIFGRNPAAGFILEQINLTPAQIPRFRDAFVSEGEIVVYCRMGEPNRLCWKDSASGVNSPECNCAGCEMVYKVPKHPNFIRYQDDTYDNTYTTLHYSIPEDKKAELAKLDIGPWEPEKMWEAGIQAIESGQMPPQLEEFGKKMMGVIKDALSETKG